MAKRYELTIKASYLGSWGYFEGIREIVQNARDSEVQFGATMKIEFKERVRDGKKTGALIVTNDGVTIPKEALLIGHTTKEGNADCIGKFGEGFKIGVVALLRLGVEIKIRNGSEVWVPKIGRSEKFNAEILYFDVTEGNKQEDRVQFEIVGISKEVWDDAKEKFLFIGKYPKSIKYSDGSVILDESKKGSIYVKGMFVAKTNFAFGYDFIDADIDRDRRMVNNLTEKTSSLLGKCVNGSLLTKEVFDLLQEGSEEVSYLSGWKLNNDGKKAIAHQFSLANPGYIPVSEPAQITELEMFGKKGIKVGWNMRTILEEQFGTAGDVLENLRKSEKVRYSLEELTVEELSVYKHITKLTSQALLSVGESGLLESKVLVVDFKSDNLLGTYNPGTEEIRLARWILSNKGKALYTLIHEAAHVHGYDGAAGHERAIGKLTEFVFNKTI
jgi:hypothetical protein